jgi:hypothetical protein
MPNNNYPDEIGIKACKTRCAPCSCGPDKLSLLEAGRTGIAPAPCGCGACCRAFSDVQGRPRAGWKWPILTAQSIRKYHNVRGRWGQQWGQTSATQHALFVWMPKKSAERSQASAAITVPSCFDPTTGERGPASVVRAHQLSARHACAGISHLAPRSGALTARSDHLLRLEPIPAHQRHIGHLLARPSRHAARRSTGGGSTCPRDVGIGRDAGA